MRSNRELLRAKRRLIGIVCGAVLTAAPSQSMASGIDAPQVGTAQSTPVADDDAAAIFHNPGQLGFFERPTLLVGGGLLLGRLRYQRERRGQYQFSDNFDFAEPIDPGDIDPSRTGTSPPVVATPVGPAFDIFATVPVIPGRFSMGLGVYIPYAATLRLPEDGPQKFALQNILLATPHATLSAGVKLHDVISIGAGVSYVLGVLELDKVQDFGSVGMFGDTLERPPINQPNDFGPDAPTVVRELDVLARPVSIKQSFAHSVSFNAGVALRPTKNLRLGLVYQHGARLRFGGDFRLDLNDDFFTQDLASQGLEYPPIVNGRAVVRLRLPKRLTLAAGYRFGPRFALDSSVSYVFYRDFDEIGIQLQSPDLALPRLGVGDQVNERLVRNWRDTVHAEVSARLNPIPKLRLSTTFGYHSPASPDATLDVASPDGHRLIFGGGIGYAFNEKWALFGDFEGQAILPRTVTDSDYDLGNGRYSLFLAQLGLHLQVRFEPIRRRQRVQKVDPATGPRDGESSSRTQALAQPHRQSGRNIVLSTPV